MREGTDTDTAAGTVSWDVTDYQGSVLTIIDNSATVLSTAAYSGTGVLTGGTLTTDVGFQGMRWDGITSLYVTPTRADDPTTNRMLSTDPMFPTTGPNGYTYTSNSPTNATDPSGMEEPGGFSTGMGLMIAGAGLVGSTVPPGVASPSKPGVFTIVPKPGTYAQAPPKSTSQTEGKTRFARRDCRQSDRVT